ncbi:hypothetical protein BN163_1870029 [Clostridioides difficile T5]|nr:hypothetical protein BN163_1870029 [Clostridioides difficile T5]CCL58897.1 hypothetical protein BN181_3930001 [Clostridioides difficile T17]
MTLENNTPIKGDAIAEAIVPIVNIREKEAKLKPSPSTT